MTDTNTKEFYEKLLAALKEQETEERVILARLIYPDDDDPIVVNVEGEEIVFSEENVVMNSEVVALETDMRMAYDAVVAKPGDTFCLYREGEYSSWDGIFWEGGLKVGVQCTEVVTLKYIADAV